MNKSPKGRAPLIGVLAMQGAFVEHLRALEAAGAKTRLVRTREDIEGLDGIVIPGGESTTMTMLMERVGLLGPLREAIAGGLATLATCAGMIVLAKDITDGMADQQGLGLLDVRVRRNGYGRQVDSFEVPLRIEGMNGHEFPGVFIRSPLVERAGRVDVVATYDGHPVAVRQDRILALCFHPELTDDLRLHREFIRMAASGGPR
ncbi:MAG: pyridoxal 5'-phosphate synthase glutaminase subunit PdxT [Chloroflexi bacterium]|nr:MAG: pyridoxal 5'-phosphate synthase glutaminase subunit PdxT [Chloroflexota bacterium]